VSNSLVEQPPPSPPGNGLVEQSKTPAATAASDIADFFGQVEVIYEDCIFELSQEQLEVQQGLMEAYIKRGATSSLAR
jgi:hypothetical protein